MITGVRRRKITQWLRGKRNLQSAEDFGLRTVGDRLPRGACAASRAVGDLSWAGLIVWLIACY
ncbi:hypothetical protein GCM10015535_60680 [Streptomyces gelaticus]|uniref:Uncharacterized protein n=1 Tax=Streptomyces gelaticus TaxID=285446 RepID=A0ABQ2W9J0_9ACTN|nr:hypothetical protein GCM10015535_60680 [Streptomyces gelaticus]